jgi:hypothetical protein
MTSLIACLGKEPRTITPVAEIIKQQEWDKVIIITDKKPDNFPNAEFLIINPNQFLPELAEEIKNKLQINDLEVALNIISGEGKLHMATLSALTKLGLGFRLIALTKQGIKEI